MSEVAERFLRTVRNNGVRVTRERRRVVETISRHPGHFDAESLHARMTAEGARVSRATVYRTLATLVECGVLRRHDVGERQALFEASIGRRHHEHMICVVCGTILEFVEDRIERLQDDVCRRYGFRPLSHALHIHGVCSSCDDLARKTPPTSTPEPATPLSSDGAAALRRG